MDGTIFVLGDNGQLLPLKETAFEVESDFQDLLAKYPDLLAGEQIDPEIPRRWLLIQREFGVPDAEFANGRWALDHLFIDQDGIPTLIEVKRKSDGRLRREVVAQMLDYAANGSLYWTVDNIKSAFEGRCRAQNIDPDSALSTLLLGSNSGIEESFQEYTEQFWNAVEQNLKAERLRLIFVADSIPDELRRIIEFLNRNFPSIDVFGLEIRHFAGTTVENTSIKTLVPRVLGLQSKPTPRGQKQWDEPAFFSQLREHGSEVSCKAARGILDWATMREISVWWGRGIASGSFVPILYVNGTKNQLFAVYSRTNNLEFYFQHLKRHKPFDDINMRRELLHRLNQIEGISLPQDSLERRPNVSLEKFSGKSLTELLTVFNWLADEIVLANR